MADSVLYYSVASNCGYNMYGCNSINDGKISAVIQSVIKK